MRSIIFSIGGSGPASASSTSSEGAGLGAGNSPRDLASARKADSAAASGQPVSSGGTGVDVVAPPDSGAVGAESILTASGSTVSLGVATGAAVNAPEGVSLA